MEPKMVDFEAFRVLGVQVRAKPDQVDYTRLWHDQVDPRLDEIRPHSTSGAYYNVYLPTDEPGVSDVVAGMAVTAEAPVPDGLVARDVPAATYAVTTCHLHEIGATWDALFRLWLPTSAYVSDGGKAAFEVFPPDGAGPETPLEVCLPVKPKR